MLTPAPRARRWRGGNGQQVAYRPNGKCLREAEFEVPVTLWEGLNTLVLKLARHWERHWMFYGNLRD